MAKLKDFNRNMVERFNATIKKTFPKSEMKEAYEGYVHIHITEENISLGTLFRIVESCKEICSIENYTVSQTTLEQVFLSFARSQLDPDELRRRMRQKTTCYSKLCSCCSSTS